MALKKYLSKHSGLYVPLPAGLREKFGNFIKFKTASGSIFGTEEKELQDFIQGVPKLDKSGKAVLDKDGVIVYEKQPLKYWKKGIIVPLPTAEELEFAAKQKEFAEKRNYISEFMAAGVSLPDESYSDSNVRKYAKSIGVQTSDADGNKLLKIDILKEIYSVFGLEFNPIKKEVKKDEK